MKKNGYLDNPKIDYVRLPEDTGGAGGFHEVMKRGYQKGFDWVWIMNGDTEPEKKALGNLVMAIRQGKNCLDIGAIASLKVSKNGVIQENHFGKINYKNMLFKPIVQTDSKKEKVNIIPIEFSLLLVCC